MKGAKSLLPTRHKKPGVLYAIAVRDRADLFLLRSVRRSQKGDAYVTIPRQGQPEWKLHTSYHASGQHHHKTGSWNALVTQKQPLDANFSGNENVLTMTVASNEARQTNAPCQRRDFDDIFEIPMDELKPDGRVHM